MSPEQQKFHHWIEKEMPYLLRLFDFKKCVYLPEQVYEFMGTASSGKAIMGQFALGVWLRRNDFGFDLHHAMRVLDLPEQEIIQSWINDPFWP